MLRGNSTVYVVYSTGRPFNALSIRDCVAGRPGISTEKRSVANRCQRSGGVRLGSEFCANAGTAARRSATATVTLMNVPSAQPERAHEAVGVRGPEVVAHLDKTELVEPRADHEGAHDDAVLLGGEIDDLRRHAVERRFLSNEFL